MVVECARIGAWHRPRYGAGEYDDMSQSALDAAVATRAAFSASEDRLCKEGTADGVVAFGISNSAMSLIRRMIRTHQRSHRK
jgi:hypothetical protein